MSGDSTAGHGANDAVNLMAGVDENDVQVVQGLMCDLVSQVDDLLLEQKPVVDEDAIPFRKRHNAITCYEFVDEEDPGPRIEASRCRSLVIGDEPTSDGPFAPFDFRNKRKSPDPNNQPGVGAGVQSSAPNGILKKSEYKRTKTSAVGYVFSPELIRETSRLPKVPDRAYLVHELICAYKLPAHMTIIRSKAATESDLRSFHSEGYVQYVQSLAGQEEEDDGLLDTTATGESYGLGYDCPSFPNMYNTMAEIAGSSLSAVRALVRGEVAIAINWCGGWHHSKSDEASGYCYVNDIVISILSLLQSGYRRIAYLDFDLHHGDAVEQAFEHTNKVLTVSFHKHEVGFFPGTGDLSDIGTGKGKGFSINVPFRDGVADDKYMMVTREVLAQVKRCYDPEFVVAQFGADGLTGDPMNSFNLTPKSLVACLNQVKDFHVPLLVLGGGGYDCVNAAKCWTQLTAAACQVNLVNDIPDHKNFLRFGPGFELKMDAGLRKDFNSFDHLKKSVEVIRHRLSLIRSSITSAGDESHLRSASTAATAGSPEPLLEVN